MSKQTNRDKEGFLKIVKRAVTSTYSKVILVVLAVVIFSISFYQYGRSVGINEMIEETSQSYSFSVGDDAYTESDVTGVLLQSGDSDKAYYEYITSKVMAHEMSNADEDFEIEQEAIDEYAMSEARLFESLGFSADEFSAHIETTYGGDDEFQAFIKDKLVRFEYAKQFGNIDNKVSGLKSMLVGLPTLTLSVSVDGNSPIEQVFTPYNAYKEFGQEELIRMSNADIGESKQFERDGVEMEYKVLNREDNYDFSDLNKDIEDDVYLYLDEDIQKEMNKRADKYVDNNKDVIKFNSALDVATYMKGQQLNNE